MILSHGSWAIRLSWPLPWVEAVTSIKVLGFDIFPTFAASVTATWERVLAHIRCTLQTWSGRRLPILLQRVQVQEVFVISKAWYFAQVIPLPAAMAATLRPLMGILCGSTAWPACLSLNSILLSPREALASPALCRRPVPFWKSRPFSS